MDKSLAADIIIIFFGIEISTRGSSKIERFFLLIFYCTIFWSSGQFTCIFTIPKQTRFILDCWRKETTSFQKHPHKQIKTKEQLCKLKKKKKIVEISVGVDVAWPGLGDRAMVTPAKKQKRHAAAALVLSLLYSQKKKKQLRKLTQEGN